MLWCICRIHLVVRWPRIRCSRYYDKPGLGILQRLFPTLPIIIFSCSWELPTQHKCFITHLLQSLSLNKKIKHMFSRASRSTQNIKYVCAPEILIQYKTSNTHVLKILFLNRKHQINYVLQGPGPRHEIICISPMKLAYTQYIKQNNRFMSSGVLWPI